MNEYYSLKIDIFTHIIPSKYKQASLKGASKAVLAQNAKFPIEALWDLDVRFRVMDKYPGLMHVLTLGMTAGISEQSTDAEKSLYLCKIGNDEMAELVSKYPDRFPAAVASIPLNNMAAALKELDRAINDLKFRGVQVFTPINDKPLDSPEFFPLYEKMQKFNLPIWIHPSRGDDYPDYRTEKVSKYRIAAMFGWPYETTAAMSRLVFSGVLEKYPNLKFITHHCGGMIPFYAARMAQFQDTDEMMRKSKTKQVLSKSPAEYFKMFYADTALGGNSPALMCAHAFFGVDHILFGTDLPYDHMNGARMTRYTINAVEEMDISAADRKKIYEDNARNLLRLPI
jgi:uncharacterized protein